MALHFCPPLAILHLIMIGTDSSSVASGSTIQASLPQSSRTVGLRYLPAIAHTDLPAASPAVIETPCMRESAINTPISFPCMRIDWNTHVGIWASLKSFCIARDIRGRFEACLSKTTFPAISCGMTFLKAWLYGKFHGAIMRIVPSGWYTISPLLYFSGASNHSAAWAKYWIFAIVLSISDNASIRSIPISSVDIRASSSRHDFMSSATKEIYWALWEKLMWDHSKNTSTEAERKVCISWEVCSEYSSWTIWV